MSHSTSQPGEHGKPRPRIRKFLGSILDSHAAHTWQQWQLNTTPRYNRARGDSAQHVYSSDNSTQHPGVTGHVETVHNTCTAVVTEHNTQV